MKTPSITVLLFLTLVAYGAATTVIFDRQNRRNLSSDRNGEQRQNEDYGLSSYSQETIGDRSDFSSDENFEFAKNTQKTIKDLSDENYQKYNNHFSESNNQNNENSQFSSNGNWSHFQSEGSSESLWNTDEADDQYLLENDTIPDGSACAIARTVVAKTAALDGIVAREHRRRRSDGNLLDVQNAVPVKKCVVKVTRRNFVSFQDAELRDLRRSGRVTRLSVDAARDRVYVECAFDRLGVNGTFKTNLAHTKAGRFAVDAVGVRSDVSTGFRRRGGPGHAVATGPGRGTVAVRVVADDRRDVGAIEDAVRQKYHATLDKAVAAEVYESTRRGDGLVALLKEEMEKPFGGGGGDGPIAVDRTVGEVNVRMVLAGSSADSRSAGDRRPTTERVSYARDDRAGAYETRFDFDLGGPHRWTGDLVVTETRDGRTARSAALQVSADRVRVRVVLVRSLEDPSLCRRAAALVRVHGLRYDADARFPSWAGSAFGSRLSGLVKRSLGAHVRHSLGRDVCHGPAKS